MKLGKKRKIYSRFSDSVFYKIDSTTYGLHRDHPPAWVLLNVNLITRSQQAFSIGITLRALAAFVRFMTFSVVISHSPEYTNFKTCLISVKVTEPRSIVRNPSSFWTMKNYFSFLIGQCGSCVFWLACLRSCRLRIFNFTSSSLTAAARSFPAVWTIDELA